MHSEKGLEIPGVCIAFREAGRAKATGAAGHAEKPLQVGDLRRVIKKEELVNFGMAGTFADQAFQLEITVVSTVAVISALLFLRKLWD
jgi:hypothetical protein